MNLLWLVAVSGVLYLFVHYWLLPFLEKRSAAEALTVRLTHSGTVAAVKFCEDTLLLAVIVYGSFALVALLLSSAFGNNVTLLGWVVRQATVCKEELGTVKGVYGQATFVFFVAGFAFLLWKERRRALSDQTLRLFEEEEDRLNRFREQDPAGWAALAPNEAMVQIDENILRLREELKTKVGKQFHNERVARIRAIKALQEKRTREDYARRVDAARIEAAMKAPGEQSRWDMLFSKGFYGDVRLGSKLLKRTATVLALLALIGVGNIAGMNRTLSGRIIRLDQLRVDKASQDVKEAWDRGLAQGRQQAEQQTELSADDRETTAYLAEQFARALLANPSWQQPSFPPAWETEASVAREAVLSQTTLPTRDGTGAQAYDANLSPDERDALRHTAPADSQSTRLGSKLADSEGRNVKSWFGSRWDDVKRAAAAHAQSYHEPLQALDMQQNALDSILSRQVSSVSERVAGESAKDNYFAKQVVDMMNDTMKSQMSDFIPTEFHSMLEDFASGKPLNEVLDHVRTAHLHVSDYNIHQLLAELSRSMAPTEASIADHAQQDPGAWRPHDDNGPVARNGPNPNAGPNGGGGGTGSDTGDTGLSPDKMFRKDVRTAPSVKVDSFVDTVSHENESVFQDRRVDQSQVEALAEYDDFFPSSQAAASNTVLAQEISAHGGEVAGVAEDVAFRVERAGSFAMLEGFSRVGGVLIGREPDNTDKTLDLRGLDWKVQNRQVWLSLRDAHGKQTLFGPYDKTLVHQALAYAADGRPVAVTMTKAQPMQALKIQLHPVLVDTPLGCRVAQLDRLTDTFAGRELPQRSAQTTSLLLQLAVYRYAWAARFGAIIKTPEEANSNIGKMVRKALANKQELALGLKQRDLLEPTGVMQLKSVFFDSDLVRAISSCRMHDANTFGSCIEDQFRDVELSEEKIKKWGGSRTDFMPWSGVRERPYQITDDLSFLQRPEGTDIASQLWPFDFLVQIAFTTPALNSSEPNSTYVDRNPLELTSLRPDIQRLVYQGIAKNGLGPSLQDLRDFAVLQRLFRAAFKGHLGQQFPVTRLATLEHETSGGIAFVYTARWQGSEMVALLRSGASQQELAEQAHLENTLGVTADVQHVQQQYGSSLKAEGPCPSLVAGSHN